MALGCRNRDVALGCGIEMWHWDVALGDGNRDVALGGGIGMWHWDVALGGDIGM